MTATGHDERLERGKGQLVRANGQIKMIFLNRSDTGQFVLEHAESNTVIVDEDLAKAYARLEEFLAEHPDRATASSSAAPDRPDDSPGWWTARHSLIVLLVLAALALLYGLRDLVIALNAG